jgi:hypothetical protein
MFKFLRKYNKWILAVGGVLLMITFLIPQAITQLSQSAAVGSAEFATVGDGERVTVVHIQTATRELQFMERLGVTMPGLDAIKDPTQWFLLVREAERAGLVQTPMLSQEQLNAYASVSQDIDANFIRRTIGRVSGVAQMLAMYMNSAEFSDRRLKRFAEELLDSVTAQTVVLEASADKATITPTEEQITAQMTAYADKLPGEGEMGFGYKLPDRIKLEWITLSVDAVRNAVESSPEFDQVAQFRHWIKNEKKTFPAPPPPGEVAPVPEDVRDDLLNVLTTQKLDAAARAAVDQLRLNRRGLPERDGFVELPAEWPQRMLKFQNLAGDLQAQFGIDLPAYESSGDRWMTIAEAADLAGLGTSYTDKLGPRTYNLSQLLEAAKELGGDGKLPLQKNVAGPPMRDGSGNVYFFRIIDADPEHAPTSVDEVRDAIVKDLKRLANYEQLVAQTDPLKQKAVDEGLLSVALSNDTVVQRTTEVSMCMRQLLESQLQQMQRQNRQQQLFIIPTSLPVIGSDEDTIKAIVQHAMSLPEDRPLWEQPENERVMVLPVKNKLAVVVARLMSENPLTKELYSRMAENGQLQQLLSEREMKDDENVVKDAFSKATLAKRNNFVEKARTTTEEPADLAASAG